MFVRIGRLQVEFAGLDLFICMPGIGELASNAVTRWCWTPWAEVVALRDRHSKKLAQPMR